MATNILLVEDTPLWARSLGEQLKRISDVNFEECARPDLALAAATKKYYDVYFVDLKYDGQYLGVNLIEKLRDMSETSVIIAYSADIPKKQGLAEQCLKAKADKACGRQEIHQLSSSSLEELITELRRLREAIVSARELVVDDDLETKAAVETIGQRTLRLLLRGIAPGYAKDSVKALSSGYSGAFVLSVNSWSDEIAKGPDLQTVAKVSRSQFALETELRRRPRLGSVLEDRAVSSGSAVSIQVDGWFAAPFSLIRDGVPLSSFIYDGPNDRVSSKVLTQLVEDVFVGSASEARFTKSSTDEYGLNWRSASALVQSLKDLSRMKRILNKEDRDSVDAVREFIELLANGEETLVNDGTALAWLHGDLHADNIFVAPHRAAVVIDFERFDVYPRLFDAAALHVDLLLARLDHDTGKDWDFSRVDRWTRLAMAAYPFRDRTDKRRQRLESSRLLFLLDSLVKAVQHRVAGVNADEYKRALLFQLTRYLKFPNVTAPKKVLAVRLFTDLMNSVGLPSKKVTKHARKRKR